MIDLVREHAAIERDLRAAIDRVVASGRFILGPEVESFELALAEKLGVKHAIGCASGSDALLISLLASGVAPGDEVLTTAFSFVATGEAIARVGAVPVFLDIDPKTYDLGEDLERIFAQVTGRTRAIVPVHLFGQVMPMRALVDRAHRLGIAVIEDAAQSIGARDAAGDYAGTRGDFGVLSFFPTKNLGALGDGGMILTNDDAGASKVRALRVHGRTGDRFELLGLNSRLDALQAAVLAVKLKHLDRATERRQSNARIYDLSFGSGAPFVRAGGVHVYNQYTVRVREREKLRAMLAEEEISSAIYYACPLHREPCFSYTGRRLLEAERASEEVLSLPIAPSISSEEIDRIAAITRAFLLP
jgi:dTDP-4-amino-4,6-dideoxygalactose transaminase